MLTLTWYEFDGARDKVLPWLAKLAEDADVEVRARASVAAGVLAAADLDHGVYHYLKPWAEHKSATLRQSAAHALNVAGRVGESADQVWRYITTWADQFRFTGERHLASTAALAAGGALGVAEPRRALRVLRRVVCDGEWSHLMPASIATEALLEAGCITEVLGALSEWTGTENPIEAREKALTMFTFAAWEEGPEGGGAAHRPALLSSSPELHGTLTELWGRALETESVRPLALDSLRAWVRVADLNPALRNDVLFLLGGIADRGTDDFERVCYALREWATERDDPLDVAADFYNEIIEAGELTA